MGGFFFLHIYFPLEKKIFLFSIYTTLYSKNTFHKYTSFFILQILF